MQEAIGLHWLPFVEPISYSIILLTRISIIGTAMAYKGSYRPTGPAIIAISIAVEILRCRASALWLKSVVSLSVFTVLLEQKSIVCI